MHGTILTEAIESRLKRLERHAFRAPETLDANERRYLNIKRAELALFERAQENWCERCNEPHNSDADYGPLIVALAQAILGHEPSDAGGES